MILEQQNIFSPLMHAWGPTSMLYTSQKLLEKYQFVHLNYLLRPYKKK